MLEALAAHVVERRESLLGDALQGQLRQVARFRTVRAASRAWVVQKRLRRIEVAVRGVVWLLPRALNEITAIVKEYTTKLGVVSVFVGALYWRLVTSQDGSGPSAPDVIGLLTKLVLPGLVLWVIGVLLFRVIVAHAGSPRSWPRRAVITARADCRRRHRIGGGAGFDRRQAWARCGQVAGANGLQRPHHFSACDCPFLGRASLDRQLAGSERLGQEDAHERPCRRSRRNHDASGDFNPHGGPRRGRNRGFAAEDRNVRDDLGSVHFGFR